ncbi:MAG: hypothetical protein ACPGPE_01135, partial [Planctomycetota bacterium]
TLLGFLLPTPGEALKGSLAERREVPLGDGDRLVVFDAPPAPGPSDGPLSGVVVHLFHGLTGSSDSNYVRLCAGAL